MAGNTITENILQINDRISRAARKAGRDPGEITLIAVTKTVETKRIKEAISAGLRVFGENYVQEAQEKMGKIKDKHLKWHFIGHLQKNKAKLAIELFDMIHTVESVDLAKELNKRAQEPLDILIQVNIAREKTKGGVDAEGAVKLAKAISAMPNLRLRGLMSIPPFFEQAEMSRPYFAMLRRLAERINKEKFPGVFIRDLSMGMSNDFEVAIEEGATMIRIGTAIFGSRETADKKAAKSA
ncbi:MAG TPA: YggS family pyridoxal phosphate-dependent enzyme [Deltaproteobacteria bacterium]|nr:MAG: YggS family pyridoxal phosphate enzyme [Deltaproteobacteria bacterium GWA2_55_82]OGQ64311.1 MAG: YggS family pyridoxal phosphate enzyme [Deltaproteobacteria bacterium RIFCSPLOWO2_02_FULL_55_12]OIJ74343.1 MAG: YggS family pyridoxal phosphate enzyme [Deltaproteobacteria bacterium GWC2_55_46]HBG46984.1 YggS family pyridoxal phosphate-dependent enzyme [Deltaproteobacteria bacterium]HCY10956.1 YggS family pyridoxal phosphate-dependent enzyme [Deltaproteobacteria bacterium]